MEFIDRNSEKLRDKSFDNMNKIKRNRLRDKKNKLSMLFGRFTHSQLGKTYQITIACPKYVRLYPSARNASADQICTPCY